MVSVRKYVAAGSDHFLGSIVFSLSGRYVEAGPELQRNLRFVGVADPPCFVYCGTNRLLDMSENKQPHIQHHVVRWRFGGGGT